MARKKSLLKILFGGKPKRKTQRKKSATHARTTTQASTRSTKPEMIVRNAPVSSRVLHIPEGDNEGNVFVYDGRPLKGTRKGSKFTLDIIRGEVTMESIYTGTVWTEGDCCVSRDGCAVGFISGYGTKAIKNLVAKHKHVTIIARREGTDSGGWPIITTLLPDYDWFNAQ